jgi:chromosome segregation ATPase
MDAFSQIVEGNVGATVVVFGVLWAVLLLQGQGLLWVGRRELARIWESEKDQNARLVEIEKEVNGEETDIKLIKVKLTDHVEKEEKVWDEIRSFGRKVGDLERKLPNGDLKTALVKLDYLTTSFNALAEEVRTHNTEAERWKRKIEVQDVRIGVLEGKKRGAG